MAVIREDVVSIGFDVPENPFADLTAGIEAIKAKLGIVDEAQAGIGCLGKEAGVTGRALSEMGNGIHAPPEDELTKPLKETQKETKKAETTFTGLLQSMKDVGTQKLTGGIDKLASAVQKPVTGIKNLALGAKDAASYIKKVGLPHALNTGLGAASKGAGKLLTKLKDVGTVSLKAAVSGMKSLASHAASAAKSLGSKAWGGIKAVGKGAAVGIAAASTALSVGAVAAFNFGAAYETSLAKVSTIADTSAVSMQDLSTDVLKLSNATGEDAAGLNEAVYQALSAGADTAGVVGLVNTAVKAAKGGYTDTTTAIDGLTSTLNAYGMATSDAEGLANQFLITQNKGKTTFGELASSIGGVAPTANAAGVGVDQLLAGVASLTANGIGTSEAMTGIKAALSNVIKPSSEAAKVAKKLGLNFSTSALQSKGLAGFLDDVKTATGGNMDTMAQLFGSVEALNTVLTLTSDQGSQLMNDTLAEMATNTTALDDAYNTMADTAQNSVTKGINSFKNLGIGIYQANEGPVAELTGLFASAGQELFSAFELGGMDGLSGQIGSTLSNILVTLTGYLPELVQAGSSIIRSLISGIMQNREQITSSVVEGLSNLAMGILQMAPDILALGGTLLMSLVQGLEQQLPKLLPVALTAIQNICDGLIQNAPQIVQSGINIILQLVDGLIAAAPTILMTGIQLVIMLAQGLVDAIPQLMEKIPQLVSAIITTLMSVDWLKVGWDIIKGIGTGLFKGIKGLFSKNEDSGEDMMGSLATGITSGTSMVDRSTMNAADGITTKIDSTNLYGSGENIMSGLNEGMLSMKGTLNSTAGNIGAGISDSLNNSLDIHSPSRVTEETGEYTGLGLVKGMEGITARVKNTAAGMGDLTARNMEPYKSRYYPEASQGIKNSGTSSEVNNWNPTFNLTLNGASASDSNERKVKRWVKESLKEAMEGMGRTNPRLQEV